MKRPKPYLGAMMAQLNDKFERVLDQIGKLHSDFLDTKGFLPEDAIVIGRGHPDD